MVISQFTYLELFLEVIPAQHYANINVDVLTTGLHRR